METAPMKLVFQTQVNANRTYFYPACEISKSLLGLMKRKALVSGDREPLERFIRSIGFDPKIEILPPATPSF